MRMGASPDPFQITHYILYDNNIDLKKKFNRLNIIANKYELSKKRWKLPFRMEKYNTEKWNYDFTKKVEFVVKK